MKKTLGTVFAAYFLSAFMLPSSAFGFCTDDIPVEYLESAKALHAENILRGNEKGACNLTGKLNKIEFTTLILRYMYADDDIIDLAKMETGTFPDLQSGIWYEDVAKAAKFEGLIKGEGTTGKGNFGKIINGAEAATLTLRGINLYLPQPLTGEQWYDPSINVMKAVNLRTYAPGHQMTRGEAVRMIYEVMNHTEMLDSAAKNYDSNEPQNNGSPAPIQQSEPNQPAKTAQSSGSFKVVSSLRHLAENFDSLSAQQVSDIIKSLSQDDMFSLNVYTAFSSLVHAKACEADSSIIMPLSTGAVNCTQTAESWQNTLYFSNGDMQQATSYAYSNRDSLLIALKCGAGEIDAGSCNLYNNIQGQNMNTMNDIFKEMLDQCVYDGQILSDGAMCVTY